jgi:hypothetical protein
MRHITENLHQLIQEYFINGYDDKDDRLPTSLCGNCQVIVLEYGRGNFRGRIQLFDHSQIGDIRPITRSSKECSCKVCDVARATTTANFSSSVLQRKKPGKPKLTAVIPAISGYSPFMPTSSKPHPLKLCGLCLTILHRGKEHHCTKGQRMDNLQSLVAAGTPKMKEKLASAIIKEKMNDANTTTLCTLATKSGRPVTLHTTPPGCSKFPLFSAEDIGKLQSSMNLSTRKTNTLMKHIRSASGNRGVIEPLVRDTLQTKNHQLDGFFECKTVDFVSKTTKDVALPPQRSTIFCHQPEELKKYVMQARKLTPDDDIILKIGIDGGGGFLKICLNIQVHGPNHSKEVKRMKFCEGVASKELKDSSVKKLFILAIVPNVEENYANVLILWHYLQLTEPGSLSPFTIATDLKLANIMLGLMAHGSAHPCTWCDAAKHELWSKGQLRTLGNIREKFMAWTRSGKGLNHAKHYGNCVHEPIFRGESETKVINIIPPPELHLMLGPVNTMFNALMKKWPEAMQWADICNVSREAIHGGSFTGRNPFHYVNGPAG